MNFFLYAIIYIIGSFFGSFFTLAVYRIPRKEDILIKHSYCPNCNHKLGFFDLFPILSYLFLGGKCRYCKMKIRPRYLILEVLSGLTFVILAFGLKIHLLNINAIVNVAFLLIYVSVLFIIAGIDKENIKIEVNVLIFGYIVELLYIIYQYTLENFNVYLYVMYITLFIIIVFLSKVILKNNIRVNYWVQNLYLMLYILIINDIKIYILTLILSLIIILIYRRLLKNKDIPIGFCVAISNIIIISISNIIINYII